MPTVDVVDKSGNMVEQIQMTDPRLMYGLMVVCLGVVAGTIVAFVFMFGELSKLGAISSLSKPVAALVGGASLDGITDNAAKLIAQAKVMSDECTAYQTAVTNANSTITAEITPLSPPGTQNTVQLADGWAFHGQPGLGRFDILGNNSGTPIVIIDRDSDNALLYSDNSNNGGIFNVCASNWMTSRTGMVWSRSSGGNCLTVGPIQIIPAGG